MLNRSNDDEENNTVVMKKMELCVAISYEVFGAMYSLILVLSTCIR